MDIRDVEKLAKRRGFFYPGSEIYGGLGGVYDYGHLGALMKSNFENLWRKWFLAESDRFYEIEPALIMHRDVFRASGHLENFVDPVVKCGKCGKVERADHLLEDYFPDGNFEGLSPAEMTEMLRKHNIRCNCGGEFEEVRQFNLMFRLDFGPDRREAYMRPETAQGPYLAFLREFDALRKKLPFGLAVIGKAFRNEISPRQLTIRQREFTQAELQIFLTPEMLDECGKWDEIEDYMLRMMPGNERDRGVQMISCKEAHERLGLPKLYVYYLYRIQEFYLNALSFPPERFRFKELVGEEKAFYNKYHWDIEYYFQSIQGFKEIGGLHYRTDHDLSGHQRVSGKSHEVFVEGLGKVLPHVLEISFGVDRNLLALMDSGWREGERFVLSLPASVSPYIAAVFPLVRKDGLDEKAREIFGELKEQLWPRRVFYDESGSIGRRYARQDEIGTPFCITVDHQTLEDGTVTIRFRDSGKQERVDAEKVGEWVKNRK